jgi:hypothetical protein
MLPLCRTMHEKIMYIEALKRGFEAVGRPVHVTNMTRLEKVWNVWGLLHHLND